MCPLGILSNYNFLRDCAGDRPSAWHCSNVHTCWKPYKALQCRLACLLYHSLSLILSNCSLFSVQSYVPLECLSSSQIITFLCFQCMSCHDTSSIISNPTKIGCILQRYSCGPNQRFICRSQLIVFSWRMSECVDCHFNVSPTAAGRRNNVTTARHQWSTSGAIVPVSPPALSPPLAHNGTHFRNIHKILAAEKLKRMPFSLRQWLALILMSPDLHSNNSGNHCKL